MWCQMIWNNILTVFRGPVSIFYMVTVSVSTFCSSHSLLSPTEILSILKTLLYEKSFSTNGKEVWDDLSALHLLCTLLLYHFNAIYNEIMQLTIVQNEAKWFLRFPGFAGEPPRIIQSGSGECDPSVAMQVGLLIFSFKYSFLFVGDFRVFCYFIIESFPLFKEVIQ